MCISTTLLGYVLLWFETVGTPKPAGLVHAHLFAFGQFHMVCRKVLCWTAPMVIPPLHASHKFHGRYCDVCGLQCIFVNNCSMFLSTIAFLGKVDIYFSFFMDRCIPGESKGRRKKKENTKRHCEKASGYLTIQGLVIMQIVQASGRKTGGCVEAEADETYSNSVHATCEDLVLFVCIFEGSAKLCWTLSPPSLTHPHTHTHTHTHIQNTRLTQPG